MAPKRDLKSMVNNSTAGLRQGAGLDALISTENTERPAAVPAQPAIERENLSTRIRKGQRKQLHRLAVELERDAQELVEEALDLLFAKYESIQP